MIGQKIPIHRNQAYLNAANGQSCVRCQYYLGMYTVGTTVSAHYHGPRKAAYGGGGSVKAPDIVSAHLCDNCHAVFDSDSLDAGGWSNKWERSEELLHWCVMTILRNINDGVITA